HLSADASPALSRQRVFDLVADTYRARGGTRSGGALPGGAGATSGADVDGIPYGGGRADIRLGLDHAGELYLLSKSDGMIRRFAAAIQPQPSLPQPGLNDWTTAWDTIEGLDYQLEQTDDLSTPDWIPAAPSVSGDGSPTSASLTQSDETRFFRVRIVP
ncbi:MAG: hypothetical protein ACOC3I_05875, partial [Verrucomicrobiota bacterium]